MAWLSSCIALTTAYSNHGERHFELSRSRLILTLLPVLGTATACLMPNDRFTSHYDGQEERSADTIIVTEEDRGNLYEGISRWTPYGSEQGAWGTCKNFRDYSDDQKQWAAVSEKFAKEALGFGGCTVRENDSPDCQAQAFADGLCGKELKVRCTSSECATNKWHSVKIVEVCPADRTWHDINDPDSKGDTACADHYVLDLDESLWYNNWSPGAKGLNNVSIEICVGDTCTGEPISDNFSASDKTESSENPTDDENSSDPASTESSNCSYADAKDHQGWGWDPVSQKSCAPDFNPDCSYADASKYNGWGWANNGGYSCYPKLY